MKPEPRIKIGDTIKIYTMGGSVQYDGQEFVVTDLEYYGSYERPVDQYCARTGLLQSPYMVVFGVGSEKRKHWEDFCEVQGNPTHKMDDSLYNETMEAMEILESLDV